MLESAPMRLIRVAGFLIIILQAGSAQTQPGFGGPGTGQVTWYLSGVRFSDGGTASGWLKYDYGALSCSADITTTAGSALSGAHYTVCGGAAWVTSGGSSAALWTLPLSSNLAGTPSLTLATGTVLADTSAAGFLPLTTGSSETTCTSSVGFGCSAYAPPSRTVIAGTVSTTSPASAVPALGPLGLCWLGVAIIFSYWFLQRRHTDQRSA